MCLAYFQIFKPQLEKILSGGKLSDILLYRNYILDCLKELPDKKTGLLALDSYSESILKNINNIITGIAMSNFQIVAIFMSDFPDYIFETLKKNNMINEKTSIMSFNEYLTKKEPKYFLDVAEEVEEMEETGMYGSDRKYLENLFICSYINEYEMFDSLYYFFRDSFFGTQMPNPFPGLILRMKMQALKYDLFETNVTFIKDILINTINEDNTLKHNNKILKNVYRYCIFFSMYCVYTNFKSHLPNAVSKYP